MVIPLPALAESFDISGSFQVTGETRLGGFFQGIAEASGAVYDTGNNSSPVKVGLTFANARVRVINFPFLIIGHKEPGAGPGFHGNNPLPSEERLNETVTGLLDLERSMENASFRILPLESDDRIEVDLENATGYRLLPPGPLHDLSEDGPAGLWLTELGRSIAPTGRAGVLTPSERAPIGFSGATFALLYGGEFRLTREDGTEDRIMTGISLNASKTVADPSGTNGLWWYDRVAITVEGTHVQSVLQADDGSRLKIPITRMKGSWAGDVTFGGFDGEFAVDGQPLPARQQLLQFRGAWDGEAAYEEPEGAEWTVAGTADFVAVDGATINGNRASGAMPTSAIAVAGVTLLAAVLAFFTHAGREFLTFITGRNVAEPLSSPARRAFLRAIAVTPGVTLSQLASLNGFTKWGASHHMRILKRAHMVDVVRNGNVDTFMLNSGSFQFRIQSEPSAAPVQAAAALAELNHPVRRRIFDALRSHGPLHYLQFKDACKEGGRNRPVPSRSDFTYHASKMEEAGLLARRREGTHVVWRLGIDVDAIKQHQRRAYARAPDVDAVLRAVEAAPRSTIDEILERVGRTRWRKPRRRVEEILLMLELSGMVGSDGPRGYAPVAAPSPQPTAEGGS